jgi:phosphatidylinositol-3-phosphatase
MTVALLATSCGAPSASQTVVSQGATLATPALRTVAVTAPHKPRPPAHVVVVVLENHSRSQIIGDSHAPYLNSLARNGALYTRSAAVTHPSQPNYLALFAGSTFGIGGDSCPHRIKAPSLGGQLRRTGHSFIGYSEGLPHTGYTGCTSGDYARKHAPWVNFTNLPAGVNRPLTAFPDRLAKLPTVSFVIPNLAHDMHNGSVSQGDAWVKAHLGRYARWARHHNSLFVVTFDENDGSAGNQITTIAYGAKVQGGHDSHRITHCNVLHTLEKLYRLPAIGCAAHTRPIASMWR